MPLETLTTEEVAVSAYKACCHAAGLEQHPDWDKEGEDVQQRWLALAHKAQTGLMGFEGKAVHQAARWLAELWGATYESLPRPLQLCWEAVARHLATLLDADDVEDVGALERSWKEWAQARTK